MYALVIWNQDRNKWGIKNDENAYFANANIMTRISGIDYRFDNRTITTITTITTGII